MRLVFLGPPGSGKGTEARLVSARLGIDHLSTGDLLREQIELGTELGKRVRETVDSGGLVPDSVVNRIVFQKIGQLGGFILDGYPRNAAQARELDRFLGENPLTAVVHLDVSDTEVERRLAGRLVCLRCGHVDNVSSLLPGVEDLPLDEPICCPECGGPLGQREDDAPDRVRRRLEVYRRETEPLLEYYSGRLIGIDGNGSKEEVADRIERRLEKWV